MEASDAWHRRAKPAFETVAKYINSLYDSSDVLPSSAMHYTTKGSNTQLGALTSVPGPDQVQRKLKQVLINEQRLRAAVAAAEEVEDAALAKEVINELEKERAAKAIVGGREGKLRADVEEVEAALRKLTAELDEKRVHYETLGESLASTKEEMLRIDRVVLSSQKQKILRPSDFKAIKMRQAQFAEMDANRLALEEEMRGVANGAVASKEAMAALLRKKAVLGDKLAKVEAQRKVKGVAAEESEEGKGGGIARAMMKRRTIVLR